jgi:hypothetical protein
LLAAICIISPVTGLRPLASLALADLQRSEAVDPDAVALLQVLCHRLDHSGEQILSNLLGHLMPFRKLLDDAFRHDGRG